MNDAIIHVKIVTPAGAGFSFDCDSLHLQTPDGVQGNEGGSFGIRRGHSDALAALADGEIYAQLNGKEVKRLHVYAGFAKIKGDSVTLITDGYSLVK